MFLGRTMGVVEVTVACEGLAGVPLLWVRPETSDGEPTGPAIVVADSTYRAGLDERVYLVDGREATSPLPSRFVPVDATIVGIVDDVECP